MVHTVGCAYSSVIGYWVLLLGSQSKPTINVSKTRPQILF